MAVELKLDTAAVVSLFPEGSEVRLKLQQAVINEVVKNLIDRRIKELQAEINTRIQSIENEARKAFTDELTRKGFDRKWGNLVLSDAAKSLIAEQARSAFSEEINKAVNAAAAVHLELVKGRLDREIDSGFRLRLDAIAKDVLRGILK